jgi:hypothetical protein
VFLDVEKRKEKSGLRILKYLYFCDLGCSKDGGRRKGAVWIAYTEVLSGTSAARTVVKVVGE